MRNSDHLRCLILACGNPLRGDDGVGPWLAAWAAERYRAEPDVYVIARQQWGPELAEEIAHSKCVLFLDSSLQARPGAVETMEIEPAEGVVNWTHHLGAAELLALSRGLYGSLPRRAVLLTVGMSSMAMGEELSETVRAAIPEARAQIERFVLSQRAALAPCPLAQ